MKIPYDGSDPSRGEGEDEDEDEDEARNGSYYIANRRVHSFEEEVMKGPLNTRAGCLQERHLSPRTLHFGATQRLWECQNSAWEESCFLKSLCPDRFGNGPGSFGGYGSKGFVGKCEMKCIWTAPFSGLIISTPRITYIRCGTISWRITCGEA